MPARCSASPGSEGSDRQPMRGALKPPARLISVHRLCLAGPRRATQPRVGSVRSSVRMIAESTAPIEIEQPNTPRTASAIWRRESRYTPTSAVRCAPSWARMPRRSRHRTARSAARGRRPGTRAAACDARPPAARSPATPQFCAATGSTEPLLATGEAMPAPATAPGKWSKAALQPLGRGQLLPSCRAATRLLERLPARRARRREAVLTRHRHGGGRRE